MIHSLPLFHRVAAQRVVVVGDGAAGEAKRRLVERAGGIPCGETEAHHARLAFVALEDPAAAAAVAERLRRKGLLVNVADRPELCDFTTPSILDRDPVLIAVSTGGASAGLAKHLRLRLEALLPQSLGRLASALYAARDRLRARYPDVDARRQALDEALGDSGPLDPFASDAVAGIDAWLTGDLAAHRDHTVEFVLTSDDPEDLTLRQARALGRADTVLHDRDISEAILARVRADAVRSVLPGDHGSGRGLTVVLRRAR